MTTKHLVHGTLTHVSFLHRAAFQLCPACGPQKAENAVAFVKRHQAQLRRVAYLTDRRVALRVEGQIIGGSYANERRYTLEQWTPWMEDHGWEVRESSLLSLSLFLCLFLRSNMICSAFFSFSLFLSMSRTLFMIVYVFLKPLS